MKFDIQITFGKILGAIIFLILCYLLIHGTIDFFTNPETKVTFSLLEQLGLALFFGSWGSKAVSNVIKKGKRE